MTLLRTAQAQANERRLEMGRIVASELITLDGVIEAPGGGEPFEHAGWSFEFDRGQAATSSSTTS